MSTTPARYQATPRLVDQPQRLRELYVEHDHSIREIAEDYADVGRTAVSEALRDHGITEEHGESDESSSTMHSGRRGLAPPRTNSVGSRNSGFGDSESAPPYSSGASGGGVSWGDCNDD